MNSHYAAQKLILGIKDPNNLRTPKYNSGKGSESVGNESPLSKDRSADANDSLKNEFGRYRNSAAVSQLSMSPDFDAGAGRTPPFISSSNYRDSGSDRHSRLSNFSTDVYELNKQYQAWKDRRIVEKYHGFLQGVLEYRRRQINQRERRLSAMNKPPAADNDYDPQSVPSLQPSSALSLKGNPSPYLTP